LEHPNIPSIYYSSFVTGFIRNSEKYRRGDLCYIIIESKVIARMVIDQMASEGIDCWEEFYMRVMCVVYRIT